MYIVLSILIFSAAIRNYVTGHGRLMDPPGRSSLWRFGFPGEPNYNDMGLNCGGVGTQYELNGGKCGICGDNYADPPPRANENGGLYGKSVIVKNYEKAGEMFIWVELTQEHKGHFEFALCDLTQQPESEECFEPLQLVGGTKEYQVSGSSTYVNHTMTLQLPQDRACDHCVIRWQYKTGNSDGICADGSQAVGCGNQEEYRSCADISIH